MPLNINLRKTVLLGTLFAFLTNGLALPSARAQEVFLPAPGTRISLSPAFNPPVLKGLKVHPDNPFRFDFILDKGDSALANDQLKDESSKLIKYFLASLTVPEKDLWVNLSPYEKDRIVPQSFGQTEMGRDLLAQDYLLKQITASLIYPEDEFGKIFWNRVYQEANKRFGTTNIPVNTFNKVWIVPEKAVVYENAKAGTAYVVESKLKVMLEADYLALQKSEKSQDTNALGSQIVREIVIPQLTREINENKNFANLRQVYNSLILATWYKKKIKDSILSQVYADKNKVNGLSFPKSSIGNPDTIYQQYLIAFKKGVYNYIKEEQDPITQQMIPRKYFSGGVAFLGDHAMSVSLRTTTDPAVVGHLPDKALLTVEANVRPDQAMAADAGRAPAPNPATDRAMTATGRIRILNDFGSDYVRSGETGYVESIGFYYISNFLTAMSKEDRVRFEPQDDIGKVYLGKAKGLLLTREPSSAFKLLRRIRDVFFDQPDLVQRVEFLIKKIQPRLAEVRDNHWVDNDVLVAEPIFEDILNLILHQYPDIAIKVMEQEHPIGMSIDEFMKIRDYLFAVLKARDRVFGNLWGELHSLESITPEFIYNFLDKVARSESANISDDIKQLARDAQQMIIKIPRHEFGVRRHGFNIFESSYMHSPEGKSAIRRVSDEFRRLMRRAIIRSADERDAHRVIGGFISSVSKPSDHFIDVETIHQTIPYLSFDGSYLAFREGVRNVLKETAQEDHRLIFMAILLSAVDIEFPVDKQVVIKTAWELIYREAFDKGIPVNDLLDKIQAMGEKFMGIDLNAQRERLMKYLLDLSIYVDFGKNENTGADQAMAADVDRELASGSEKDRVMADSSGMVPGQDFSKFKEHLRAQLNRNQLVTHLPDIEKSVNILHKYPKIVFEIGGGNGNVALAIARKNQDIGVISTDEYDTTYPNGYNAEIRKYYSYTQSWEERHLEAQTANLDNLAILRSKMDILLQLPDHSIDYFLLVNPTNSVLEEAFVDLVWRKLKVGGQIVIKTYAPFSEYQERNYVPGHSHFENLGTKFLGVNIKSTADDFFERESTEANVYALTKTDKDASLTTIKRIGKTGDSAQLSREDQAMAVAVKAGKKQAYEGHFLRDTTIDVPGRRNEDDVFLDPNKGALAVIDGLGGHGRGDEASRIVIDTVKQAVDGTEDFTGFRTIGKAEEFAEGTLVSAEKDIISHQDLSQDQSRMGASAVFAFIWRDPATTQRYLIAAKVGDVRLYVVKAGVVKQLGKDDVHDAQQLLREGRITEEFLQKHPGNPLSDFLGNRSDRKILKEDQIFSEKLDLGDKVFAFTDGITKSVPEKRVRQIIAGDDGPAQIVERLMAEAKAGEYKDDITVAALQVPADRAMAGEAKKGGIDLNAVEKKLQTQNSNGEIKFNIDPATLEQLQNAPGFVPVIINIQPLNNLPEFLGLFSNVNASAVPG